ncbi:MAG: hypothetical protein NXH83_13180 [Rhodobacteraceae bacterium]|jgi:hypothetical protein|nr:hypothetical protein [Paracoccaceae bacterium]
MNDRIPALVGFLTLAAFLAILVWHVPRLDLGAVAAVTLAFAAWDFFGRRT